MSSPVPISQARRPSTPKTITALMLREMATTYGRSPGGFLWAIAEPVAAIALLSIAFSVAFRTPPLGQSFVLFYATGYLPFMLFLEVSGKVSQSLRFNRPLLTYPAVTFFDTIVARFVLNTVVYITVAFIVLGATVVLLAPRTIVDVPAMTHAFAMAAGLALGFGVLNCYLFLAFPVWENVWRIVTRPLFILSGIFFLFETVPDGYKWLFWYNPLVHSIGEARAAFYPVYDATYVTPAFVWGVNVVAFATGLLLLRRNYRSLLLK